MVIFAHAFFKDYRDLSVPALFYKAFGGSRNLYVDISATSVFYANSPEARNLVWHLRQFGIDHVFFGSDYPAFTPQKTRLALNRLPFTPAERDAILGANFRKMLGL